jgi:outer membrane protein
MAARFKVANEKLEKDMPTLSEADRASASATFSSWTRNTAPPARVPRRPQRTNEERQAISEKATKIIQQMAHIEGYDIVLQDAVWASNASTSPTRS